MPSLSLNTKNKTKTSRENIASRIDQGRPVQNTETNWVLVKAMGTPEVTQRQGLNIIQEKDISKKHQWGSSKGQFKLLTALSILSLGSGFSDDSFKTCVFFFSPSVSFERPRLYSSQVLMSLICAKRSLFLGVQAILPKMPDFLYWCFDSRHLFCPCGISKC